MKRLTLLFIAATATAQPPLPLLERFCVKCHDAETKKGGVDLESFLQKDAAAHPEVWEGVVKQLNARHMPPVGKNRPSEAEYAEIVQALTHDLDAQPAKPVPSPALRRLTRTEYQYAVRDLLGVDFDAKAAFPTDEISHGFDNITVGDLPPALLDRYITAAQKIAKQAVGRATEPEVTAIRVRPDLTQEYHIPGLPLGTRGGVLLHHFFPQAGQYEVSVRLQRDRNEQVEGMKGRHELHLLLNGELVEEFTIKPGPNQETLDAHLTKRFAVPAGKQDLGVTFVQNGKPLLERLRQPYKVSYNTHRHPRLSPAVYQVTITGPFDAATPQPAKLDVLALARRAWRRDLTDADQQRLLPIVEKDGLEAAVAAILVSREFLFRQESKSDDNALASKLAFFLWSSLPDEELLVQRPLQLESQVKRMLQDPRATALISSFADQWLYLRNLDSTTPDARLFPDFDHNLRESLKTETSLLFQDVMQNDRSVLDLLKTDRTWLDERLAAHYGIPHVYGSRWRAVPLQPEWQRGGLLRQGSILTVTSYATRTSPVIRGHWILKNLLGAAPPPPPPDVPALDGVISENLPMRERLAKHREMAACASCHNLMDPIGFALENYDALGRWLPEADARGGFADGSSFTGVAGLEEVLLKRPELFVTALTEKLLVYALGRGLEPADGTVIRSVVQRAKDHGWRFSAIIQGIVTSTTFRS
jgi:hypothetical protein